MNKMSMFMTVKEYINFKPHLRNMKEGGFIKDYEVAEGGEDMIEVIIYKGDE